MIIVTATAYAENLHRKVAADRGALLYEILRTSSVMCPKGAPVFFCYVQNRQNSCIFRDVILVVTQKECCRSHVNPIGDIQTLKPQRLNPLLLSREPFVVLGFVQGSKYVVRRYFKRQLNALR